MCEFDDKNSVTKNQIEFKSMRITGIREEYSNNKINL